jgi:hypothetical protein
MRNQAAGNAQNKFTIPTGVNNRRSTAARLFIQTSFNPPGSFVPIVSPNFVAGPRMSPETLFFYTPCPQRLL